MASRSLLLLADYRGAFYSSMANMHGLCSVDLESLISEFSSRGWDLECRRFSGLDLRKESFADRYVLYQSAEDPGLHYKQYIEDLLLGLELQGARLVPEFRFFRAHHNKAFMELLRDLTPIPGFGSIRARVYGTYEDFERDATVYPAVIKGAEGAGSVSVRLIRDAAEKAQHGKAISWTGDVVWSVKEWLKRMLRRTHVARSVYRRRFVVQDFIENLACDYKVLVYGGKYYVLQRRNRPGDFRASGSGLFSWPTEPPEEVLDLALNVFEGLDVPFLSADVAWDGCRAHVLEFQCVSFGPLTMERSEFYFSRGVHGWSSIHEKPNLAREIARSVTEFIHRREDLRSLQSGSAACRERNAG
jgi:glutathione synthase/RimK-type ligase-like ATP-grasp enzyme